ncbi:MAG: hypothetical protein KDD53_11210, partial [Bdellovibrionales bacterium]|nr:hypothetical protein [Bdellovibrionales bacterium]
MSEDTKTHLMDTPQGFRYLLYLFAITLGFTFWTHPVRDPDLSWHLLGGEWVLNHLAVPNSDFINTFNTTWVDYHWLSQVLLYLLYSFGGFWLLRVAHGFLVAYLFLVLLDICVYSMGRRTSNLLLAVFLSGATLCLSFISTIRPQMIALLIIACTLRRLIQKPERSEILFCFAMTALCSNIHVYWIFIPYLYFLYRMLPCLFRGKPSWKTPLLGSLILPFAGFLSPYGWKNYWIVWTYLNMPEFLTNSINEFKSLLAMNGPGPWLMLGYCIAIGRTFRAKRALVLLPSSINAIIGPLLAILRVKFISLFAILSLPYLVRISTSAL